MALKNDAPQDHAVLEPVHSVKLKPTARCGVQAPCPETAAYAGSNPLQRSTWWLETRITRSIYSWKAFLHCLSG